MKLPRVRAGTKIAYGSLQLVTTLTIMVFFFVQLIKYGEFDPCVLSVAVILCFSGVTFIGRGRKELAVADREHSRKNKPKPPRPDRPKGPPGKQRPDRERRKTSRKRRTAPRPED